MEFRARSPLRLLTCLLSLAGPCGAATDTGPARDQTFPGGMPATPKERFPELMDTLDRGDWNERIHAVNGLGAMVPDGLPGLARAMGDFDWQVRFTALHWLGRFGDAAVPQLRRALREDPCRVIRISALHWLGSLGGSGISAVQEAADDPESGILRLSAWYWLRKRGAVPASVGAPSGSGAEDLNVCADFAERPGPQVIAAWKRLAATPFGERRTGGGTSEEDRAALADLPDGAVEVAVLGRRQKDIRSLLQEEALPPPKGLPERPSGEAAAADLLVTEEVDALLFGPEKPKTRGQAEALPPGPPPVEMRRDPSIDAAALLNAGAKPASAEPQLEGRRNGGSPETLPPGSPPVEMKRDPSIDAAALLNADAGAKPVPADPLPELLKLLGSSEARVRSRAADELGKLGKSGAPAVVPLRKLLADGSPRVRASAALALGNIGPAADPAVKGLVAALKDPSAAVRYGATLALSRIGTPAAQRAFRRYLRREVDAAAVQNR